MRGGHFDPSVWIGAVKVVHADAPGAVCEVEESEWKQTRLMDGDLIRVPTFGF